MGLVVKSKEEAFWISTIKETEQTIEAFENKLKFEKAVLQMCLLKLKRAELFGKRKCT